MTPLWLALVASAAGGAGDATTPGPDPGPGPGPGPADSVLIQVDNAIADQTIDGFRANTLSLVFPTAIISPPARAGRQGGVR